ncbi:MAG: class I SAM-dependent methyltransferase [Pseudonocardiaceae bacterium]
MDLALRQRGCLPLEVERSDGHRSRTDLRWWLRDSAAEPPHDAAALRWLRQGPVLDVGCATGRYVEMLRARGIDASGLDTCPAAVELAVTAGQPCRVGDAWKVPAGSGYTAVTALGGNLGIAGTVHQLRGFLALLSAALRPGGLLVASSVDWRVSASQHRVFLQAQGRAARYPGEVRLRLRCADAISTWFPWLWVDRDTLRSAAADVGLLLDDELVWRHHYAARLRKGKL